MLDRLDAWLLDDVAQPLTDAAAKRGFTPFDVGREMLHLAGVAGAAWFLARTREGLTLFDVLVALAIAWALAIMLARLAREARQCGTGRLNLLRYEWTGARLTWVVVAALSAVLSPIKLWLGWKQGPAVWCLHAMDLCLVAALYLGSCHPRPPARREEPADSRLAWGGA